MNNHQKCLLFAVLAMLGWPVIETINLTRSGVWIAIGIQTTCLIISVIFLIKQIKE